jgi:hypothetical protein
MAKRRFIVAAATMAAAGIVVPTAAWAVALVARVSAATPVVSFAPLKTVAEVRWDGWLDEVGVADVTGDGNPDIVGVKFFDGNAKRPTRS